MLDQADVVEIIHSDGTIGVYAHLHWDSIRVRIGEHIARGQYIADSGNTGFSSGPHLHFAVVRNAGGTNVSVPIQFAALRRLNVNRRVATMRRHQSAGVQFFFDHGVPFAY